MGFRPAIEAILRYMPDCRSRQTLLFSATMPQDVRKIAQLALKDQYQFVDCVGEEESTHQHVPQQFTVCGQEQQVRWVCLCVCVCVSVRGGGGAAVACTGTASRLSPSFVAASQVKSIQSRGSLLEYVGWMLGVTRETGGQCYRPSVWLDSVLNQIWLRYRRLEEAGLSGIGYCLPDRGTATFHLVQLCAIVSSSSFFYAFCCLVSCSLWRQAEELCQLLRENMAADPRGHKIIVFFTTARLTQFYAELCNLMVSHPN